MINRFLSIKYLSIIALSVVISLASCGHKGDKNDPNYKKVIAIHDEVMPKMSTIHKLKKKLRIVETANTPEVMQMLKDLEDADEGMMTWMSDFDPPAEGPERTTYLQKELSLVKDMADDINNSISAAESYLKTYSNEK